MSDHALGSLLGRWHQWRRVYSHERGFARVSGSMPCEPDEDELEALLMHTMEEAIGSMAREKQLALQHVARAECLGAEVMFNPHLVMSKAERETLCQRAMHELQRRLIAMGVL